MVEILTTTKRKRQPSNKRPICDKASRYPPRFHFSALTYKQAPKALSISTQSILVSVPTQPNPTQFNTISGDIFHLDGPLHKSPIPLVEAHHKHHVITHLEWNQKGNTIASVDEIGQLALWHINSSVNDWTLVYKVDMKQPLAAFLWLNSDRLYGIGSDKREPMHGPRNPFGQLGFITITVHGEITVHYQHNGAIFSTFSTPMPNIGRRDISRADAGCFGMSLAGLDDWERISHAAITLHEGHIYLATHHASIQPKSVSMHTLKIKFPAKSDQGAIECRPMTSLKIQDNHVTQMMFKKGISTVELVLGLGVESEDGFHGCIATWQLKKIYQSISSNFGTITNDRTALVYQSGTKIKGRFISCLTSTSTSQTIVGLSDGSVHAELAIEEGLVRSNKMEDVIESIDANYWTVVEPTGDTVVDIVLSPNETHVLYLFASSNIGIARITNDDMNHNYVKALTRKLLLCLLNDTDFIDLVSEIVRMSKQHKDKPDEIINNVLKSYEIQVGGGKASDRLEFNEPLENWSLAKLEKGYGLAMAVYTRLSGKEIQSMNLTRAVQLPIILDCFISSGSSTYEEILSVLEKETMDDSVTLEFDPESLWSLVSLSTWMCDYVRWVLREWNMLFHCKRPRNSAHGNISEKSVHAVLLLHKDSRIALIKILKLLHYFIQYTSTTSYQLEQFSESQGLLQGYISTLLSGEIIAIKDTVAFLNALDELQENTTEIKNRWSLLLSSNIKTFSIPEIQNLTNAYKDKCAKPSIYLEKETLYPYDVIRKRRIPNNIKTHHCVRCQQQALPIHTLQDMNDPCSSAQWYQSLGRRCVCGGIFY